MSYRSRESPDCGSFGNKYFSSLTFLTFGNSISIFRRVSYSAGYRSILFLLTRTTFSKFCYHLNLVLWLAFAASYSSVCPSAIGCALFLVLQASSRILFHSPTHQIQGSFMLEPYFPAASIHLHRQYVSRMDITRIASSKVPFLTSFRSRSRFSGGSF